MENGIHLIEKLEKLLLINEISVDIERIKVVIDNIKKY